ncbi:MAG: ATP-binding protein [Deltaproteobacteria bacterium]|nr:ATP-binding protein [Deltaproteobacteria bacterium]
MKRIIDKELLLWKGNRDRKVLLVRGARQVGKTYSMRQLGKSFKHFVEVNFEELKDVRVFFDGVLSPDEIIRKLSVYFNTPINPHETLLFFDEIQACPNALQSLRFFHEKMKELHVAAAGSLLEFVLSEISSFGVGRIETFFMYPMTFAEFLKNSGDEGLNQIIADASLDKPVDEVFHNKILDRLKLFQIIGGMPETVRAYIETQDFTKCQKSADTLITSINDDFAKYRKRLSAIKLQETFKSIIMQVGNKFKYSNISDEPSSGYKNALDLLIRAGLAYKVFHTSARGLPLGAQIDEKKFKVLFFDTGIYQRVMGLDLASYMSSPIEDLVNKGAFAELFVGLELIASEKNYVHPELYYWHREAKSSNAEVDYIVSVNNKIIPIEVKSSRKGQMQSLRLFLKERNKTYGIRISCENFGKHENIISIPLYAIPKLYEIISSF